jgi:hypothetical protein
MAKRTRTGFVVLCCDGDVIHSSQETQFPVFFDRKHAQEVVDAFGGEIAVCTFSWEDGMTPQFPVSSEVYYGIYQLPNGKWSFAEDNVVMNDQEFDTELEAHEATLKFFKRPCPCEGLMPENVLGADGRCIKCGTDLT